MPFAVVQQLDFLSHFCLTSLVDCWIYLQAHHSTQSKVHASYTLCTSYPQQAAHLHFYQLWMLHEHGINSQAAVCSRKSPLLQ